MNIVDPIDLTPTTPTCIQTVSPIAPSPLPTKMLPVPTPIHSQSLFTSSLDVFGLPSSQASPTVNTKVESNGLQSVASGTPSLSLS